MPPVLLCPHIGPQVASNTTATGLLLPVSALLLVLLVILMRHLACRPEDTGADVKSDAPEKAACTLASNGKQSCIFSCLHDDETAKMLKVFDDASIIKHKAGPWDGEKHLAMTSDLNQ